jgi:protein-tyrosine phosphatase
MTASALNGRWGDKAKKVAHWLLEREAVHILATDSHSVEGRPPILSEARDLVSRSYGQPVARALVDDNPRAVVSGRPLPYFPRVQ